MQNALTGLIAAAHTPMHEFFLFIFVSPYVARRNEIVSFVIIPLNAGLLKVIFRGISSLHV